MLSFNLGDSAGFYSCMIFMFYPLPMTYVWKWYRFYCSQVIGVSRLGLPLSCTLYTSNPVQFFPRVTKVRSLMSALALSGVSRARNTRATFIYRPLGWLHGSDRELLAPEPDALSTPPQGGLSNMNKYSHQVDWCF